MGFIRIYDGIASGKRLHFAMEAMAHSINSMVIFQKANCFPLPEGRSTAGIQYDPI
jgi:hypothetical protein